MLLCLEVDDAVYMTRHGAEEASHERERSASRSRGVGNVSGRLDGGRSDSLYLDGGVVAMSKGDVAAGDADGAIPDGTDRDEDS